MFTMKIPMKNMLKNMYSSVAQSVAQRLGCSDMDLIDRNELIRQIRLQANRSSLGETVCRELSFGEMAGLIFDAPTVAAEPVVYCKECVRRYDITCPMHYEEHVSHWTGDGYLENDIVEYDNTIDMGFCHLCCNGCD